MSRLHHAQEVLPLYLLLWTAVRAKPLQRGEVAVRCGESAGRRIPWAALRVKPLQTAKRVGGHIERPSKRIATSHEGKILAVGTPKRVVELYIYKKVITLENDRYLVTSRDKLTKLHAMTINKKNVQGYVADISPEDMALLGKAEMPSRF